MDDFPPSGLNPLSTARSIGSADAIHPWAQHYRALITAAGEDVSRQGLVGTPHRAAQAFEFLTRGYREDVQTLVNGAVFDSPNRDMVTVRDIEFYSLCEHHILPFYGHVHVAYLPAGRVIGLSKIPRIVDMYARRLQIQENLTSQIAQCVADAVGSPDVAVVIQARHMCMLMRGVEKQAASMGTSTLLGRFRDDASVRAEFLQRVPQC